MRPHIVCHMASSIDGRIQAERWTPTSAGPSVDVVMPIYEEVADRLDAQGWIVGRKTMDTLVDGRSTAEPVPASGPIARTPYVGDRQGRPLAVVIDSSGKIRHATNEVYGAHIVAVVGEQVSDAYLAELQDTGVSYVFAGRDGRDVGQAMSALAQTFGISRILLEGGGITNGEFLMADLVDEISLLIYPGIDGLAGVPAVFEHFGADPAVHPAAGRSLRLLSCEVLAQGLVWLRYSVHRDPA